MPDLVDFSGGNLFEEVNGEVRPPSDYISCERKSICPDSVKADHSYFCLDDSENCPVKRT